MMHFEENSLGVIDFRTISIADVIKCTDTLNTDMYYCVYDPAGSILFMGKGTDMPEDISSRCVQTIYRIHTYEELKAEYPEENESFWKIASTLNVPNKFKSVVTHENYREVCTHYTAEEIADAYKAAVDMQSNKSKIILQ